MGVTVEQLAEMFGVNKQVSYGFLRFLAESKIVKTSKVARPKGTKGKPATIYHLNDSTGSTLAAKMKAVLPSEPEPQEVASADKPVEALIIDDDAVMQDLLSTIGETIPVIKEVEVKEVVAVATPETVVVKLVMATRTITPRPRPVAQLSAEALPGDIFGKPAGFVEPESDSSAEDVDDDLDDDDIDCATCHSTSLERDQGRGCEDCCGE